MMEGLGVVSLCPSQRPKRLHVLATSAAHDTLWAATRLLVITAPHVPILINLQSTTFSACRHMDPK